MEALRSYVVRLYRHDPEGLAGVVESVETGEAQRFRSADELWAALHQVPSRRPSTPIDLEEDEP